MSGFNPSEFQNPPKSARPMARWWWPGLDVDLEELKREIADLDAGGFAGAEIQAFLEGVPSHMQNDPDCRERLNRYRTPFYFDTVAALLDECADRGMILDLTVCSGWPTNGVDVPLAQGQKHLYMAVVDVEGGARTVDLPTADDLLAYRAREPKAPQVGPFAPPPDDTEVLRKTLRLVGVSAARCVGEAVAPVMTRAAEKTGVLEKPVDLWAHVEDGKLNWSFPDGAWQVFCYYAGENGTTPHMAAREDASKPNYIVDHFGKGVIAPYLDRHIGADAIKKHAGKTLRAFFTDSFELSSPWTWTDDFLAEFEARRGYDLRPYLMLTHVPGCESMFARMLGLKTPPMYDIPDVGERVRHDYQLTIADLFDEYFLGAMMEWGDSNKLQSRVQCYGHSMDNIKAYGRTHIPETEQLAGNGVIDFMKLAGSASLLYQQPVVTSEALVWIRSDYMTTPTKMKIAADKLFISGINQLIYHGMPYRHPEMPFPHYHPFHGSFGSFICRDNTLWDAIGAMNARISRGQYLMQSGAVKCDVAVYYQKLDYVAGTEAIEELTAGVLPGFDRAALGTGHGSAPSREPTAEQARGNIDFALSHGLMRAGYDYFHLNEECLMRAELIDGALVTGDAQFRALIVNDEQKMPVEAAYKLRALMDAGFPVIFLDDVPAKVPGLYDHRRREQELSKALDGARPIAQADAPAALREAGVLPGIECQANDLQHIRRDLGGQTLWFVRSTSAERRMLTVKLNGARGDLRILDVSNGDVVAPAHAAGEDGISIELPFAPYGSWFLLTGEATALPAPTGEGELMFVRAVCAEAGQEIAPIDGWHITGKNAVEGGADAACTIETLVDWADVEGMDGFSGTAKYTCTLRVGDVPAGRALIDLGTVGDTARLSVNGECVGEAITLPYAFEVTGKLRAGENSLEIDVTNTLRNGLVATDAFKGGRVIGGPGPRVRAMSGILGPVTIRDIS
ncbi:MAG: glycosyl hydrolase [Christensenellales bacterium]|jgi:hypothetical protein